MMIATTVRLEIKLFARTNFTMRRSRSQVDDKSILCCPSQLLTVQNKSSTSHGQPLLLLLIEFLNCRSHHPQWQRSIKTAKLQLHQLEALGCPKFLIRKQAVKSLRSVDWTMVLGPVVQAKRRCELRVILMRELVVRSTQGSALCT